MKLIEKLLIFFLFNTFQLCFGNSTIPTVKPIRWSSAQAVIRNFIVFSADAESAISFDPKLGWIIGQENRLRVYLSGSNLENVSIVFSDSSGECSPNDDLSAVYRLSSSPIIELNVHLRNLSKLRSSISICLIPSSLPGENLEQRNVTKLRGPYFTLFIDQILLPFPLKICLILMLFLVSGFFR